MVVSLNGCVVYFVHHASTTPKCWFVMISADNKTFKVWHMLGRSHDKMNLKWCAKKPKTAIMSMLHTKGKTAIYYNYTGKEEMFTCMLHSEQMHHCVTSALTFERWDFSYSSQPTKMWKEAMTDRKQLFIGTHIHKVPAAVYTISRTAGPSIFVCPVLKSPRKIPTVPGQRKDYCFPICCPVQTQSYQSKPGQLLFHILLMYWKAFHSRLPLIAGPEQVSVPSSTMENNQAFLLD